MKMENKSQKRIFSAFDAITAPRLDIWRRKSISVYIYIWLISRSFVNQSIQWSIGNWFSFIKRCGNGSIDIKTISFPSSSQSDNLLRHFNENTKSSWFRWHISKLSSISWNSHDIFGENWDQIDRHLFPLRLRKLQAKIRKSK